MDQTAETTAGERGITRDTVVGSQKPLHRFVNGEPRCVGIVVLFFGCGELLMGIPLVSNYTINSTAMYIPFWLGALFVISGNLSIYTESHPSKKMVTVCLSMYVVTLFGIFIALCYRLYIVITLSFGHFVFHPSYERNWISTRSLHALIHTTEGLLLALSLFVSVLLLFLSCRARAALKSTKTQVIVQHRLSPRE
ncbi:hypothetical protein JZ751_008710 [Albula glossodonta]|uniref:Uncharacterized protein n=1 Tax=Albula glossodonta TaxID=121402 RepID=A0A8T2P1E5_9TELE|nr:hypothetical protein JZ751_008710 [Albula glossodonta]